MTSHTDMQAYLLAVVAVASIGHVTSFGFPGGAGGLPGVGGAGGLPGVGGAGAVPGGAQGLPGLHGSGATSGGTGLGTLVTIAALGGEEGAGNLIKLQLIIQAGGIQAFQRQRVQCRLLNKIFPA